MLAETAKFSSPTLLFLSLFLTAVLAVGVVVLISVSELIVYGLLATVVLAASGFYFFTKPVRALIAFILLLPIHSFAVTVLIAQVHVPLTLAKALAAWKEVLLVAMFIVALGHLLIQKQRLRLVWVDGIALLWLALVIYYFLFHDLIFNWESNLTLRLYGARDWLLYLLPFFIGRLIFVSDRTIHKLIKVIILVGVLTSIFGILEYFFIPTAWHVTLGVPTYFADFLNLPYPEHTLGLPYNYWTSIRGTEIRRAVSTYLSGQGFAIPFLLIIPVVTYNYLVKLTRHSLLIFIVCWVALLLTITRMTIVVCFIQTLACFWIFGRKKLVMQLMVAVFCAFTILLLSNTSFRTYVIDTLTFQDESGRTRPSQWITGIQVLMDNPLGLGLGSAGVVGARFGTSGAGTEAGYFKITGVLGLFGLFLFLAWFWGILSCASFVQHKLHGISCGLAGITWIAAVGFLLNNLTAPPDQSTFVIYVFGWLAGLAVQQATQLAPIRPPLVRNSLRVGAAANLA